MPTERLRPPALVAEGLTFGYPQRAGQPSRPLFEDLDLTLEPGGFTVVLGPNGAGKSTLIKLLAGLLAPERGVVRLGDRRLAELGGKERGRTLAYLDQDEPPHLPFSVLEVCLMGRFPHQAWWPFDSTRDLEACEHALDQAGALSLRDRPLAELSGGERQRVFLARALAQEPSLLLFDEPAANLDLAAQVELYRTLGRLNRELGMTVLCVSHEVNVATHAANQVVLLRRGGLRVGPRDEVLTAEALTELYGTEIHAGADGFLPVP